MAARRVLLLALLALVPFALPQAASGALAQREAGGVLTITGGPEPNGVTVALNAGSYTITDTAGMDEGPGCSSVNATTSTCAAPLVTSLSLTLGDGTDGFSSTVSTPAKVLGGGGEDDLAGGTGPDELVGGPGNDMLRGGAGPDIITGESVPGEASTGENTMEGGSGNDLIEGASGIDTISGGADDDMASGGGNSDSVDGGDGNDVVSGGNDDDTMMGGAGNDQLGLGPDPQGQPRERGDDTIDGGTGDDVLLPGLGVRDGDSDDDSLRGGDGVDEVTYAIRSARVVVTIDDVANDGFAGEHDNVRGDVEKLTGGSADDELRGGPGGETLSGGPSGDLVDGGGGSDTTDGGEGNDTVSGGAGVDVVLGGEGDDQLDGSVAALVGVDGGDALAGGPGNDRLGGGDGNDALDGGPGADEIAGGPGVDGTSYASATAAVTVTLDGQPGDGQFGEGDNVQPDVENLGGGGGDDTFTASDAANALDMGGGEDYSDGGDGPDAIVMGPANDVVRSRDGFADVVDCGDDTDFAIADRQDTLSKSCERADLGGSRARLRKLVVLRPVRDGTAFGLRGMRRTVPLLDRVGLPLGSRLDATDGAVKLTAARVGGRTQSGVFSRGAFLVKQPRRGRGLTELTLTGGDLTKCNAARAGVSAAGRRTIVLRRLFGRGRGRFRTRGRHSTATVRGTSWTVVDRCDGTLTTVQSGRVSVFDRHRRRTVVLHRGERYLAKAP